MIIRSFKNEKYPRDSPAINLTEDTEKEAEDDVPQDATTLSGVECKKSSAFLCLYCM
jgi:hypothetical protein